jgi:hypothetical protein
MSSDTLPKPLTEEEVNKLKTPLKEKEEEKPAISADQYQVKRTAAFKLKDRPNRGGIMFDLMATFGFIPEKIIIQKVRNESNKFVLSAVKTAEVMKIEQEQAQNMAEKVALESKTDKVSEKQETEGQDVSQEGKEVVQDDK